MTQATTIKDFETTVFEVQPRLFRSTITIPAGTRVRIVESPMGVAYAVDDIPLLIKLTGNEHDPHYRYVFVPNSYVDGGR